MDIHLVEPTKTATKQCETAHCLPCTIHHTGKANTKQYFVPLLAKDQGDPSDPCEADTGAHYTSTFRGRSIKGCVVKPPAGLIALHLKPTTQTQSDIEEQTWAPVHKLQSFAMWKLETPPQPNDPALTWTETVSVAEKAHTPMTAEELEELEAFHKQSLEEEQGR